MRNENHLPVHSVLPLAGNYMVNADYSNYPAFTVVRAGHDLTDENHGGFELPVLLAAAVAEERKLIGQELHDNVNQLLTTVKLFIEMLKPEDVRDKDIRRKTIQYITMAIEDIRQLSGELVKNDKTARNLLPAISSLLDDVRFTTAIGISFRHKGPVERIDEKKSITLLRIVQEQLNNVIKYSQATEVAVCLFVEENIIRLSIKDNGIGFDACSKRSGIGLHNIYDRVASCKGTVELQTSKGNGCCLSVSLPLLTNQ
jgi:two-component system, NarL family, sensor histidine kinase UhpB